MKKITYLVLVLFLVTQNIHAQFTYWDSQSIWSNQRLQYEGSDSHGNPYFDRWFYNLYFKGDTMISGNRYSKLYSQGEYSPAASTQTSHYRNFMGYFGYSNNKIINRDTVHGRDTVVIDYNLHVGDLIRNVTFKPAFPDTLQVSSIDSVLINANYHKRFFLTYQGKSSNDYPYLLEGLGSSYGFIEAYIYPFETWQELICYGINQTTQYQNPYFHLWGGGSCDYSVGIKENKQKEIMYKVYPNPFTDELTFACDAGDGASVEVMDIYGRILYKQVIFQNETKLNMHMLTKGIYFLKIKIESNVGIEKIIKE